MTDESSRAPEGAPPSPPPADPPAATPSPAPTGPSPGPAPGVASGASSAPAPAAPATPATPAPEPAALEPTPEAEEPASADESAERAREAVRGRLELGLLALAVLLAAGVLAFLQGSTRELVDHDSLYHVRAANILWTKGLLRGSPWMQASLLHDHFADKEFLFHAVLAPFCADEATMDRNAKVVAVLLGAGVFAAFAFVLRGLKVRHAWLWVLALLGCSSDWLVRLTEVRPHLLAIILMLVGVRFILERRWLALYFLTFAYTWSYSAPELIPGLALVALVARAAREQTVERTAILPFVASTLGIVFGLTLNPFVPHSYYVFWVQNVLVIERALGLVQSSARLGAELYPMATRSLLETSPGLCLAFAIGFGACLLARRRPGLRTVQLGALALAGGVLLFAAEKLMDYAAPLAVLFAASAVDDQWRGEGSRAKTPAALAYLLAVLGLVGLAAWRVHERVAKLPPPPLRAAAQWLRAHAPPGEVVAHFSWDDFSTLFHDDPGHYYLVGLDPTFMEVWYPEELATLEAIRTGRQELDPAWLVKTFHARWVVVPRFRHAEVVACDVAGLEARFGTDESDPGIVYAVPDR